MRKVRVTVLFAFLENFGGFFESHLEPAPTKAVSTPSLMYSNVKLESFYNNQEGHLFSFFAYKCSPTKNGVMSGYGQVGQPTLVYSRIRKERMDIVSKVGSV